MGTATSVNPDSFTADLHAALQVATTATTAKSRKAGSSTFTAWAEFCQQEGRDATLVDLPGVENKLLYLMVFGLRYRQQGRTGDPVRADTVAKALRAVGQGIANMGHPDPRKPAGSDKLYPLLAAFLRGLANEDEPQSRSYPVNLQIIRNLREVLDTSHPEHGTLNTHIIDVIIVAFYWLLRPAEYLETTAEGRSQAFLLRHIQFIANDHVYPASTVPLNDAFVRSITNATLEFADQKNAVRGEVVGHKSNNDPFYCPAKALWCITRRLRLAGASPDTPLHRHYNSHPNHQRWYSLKSSYVTNALRHAAAPLQATTGISPDLISTRSLRPGGATALLCANVDPDVIKLLGRWKSDAMFRYLRIQASTQAVNYAQHMLDHGNFTFAPNAFQDQGLPHQAPAAAADLYAARDEFLDA